MLIHSKQGSVRGIEKISVPSSKTFYSFLGIPYAEPPVDKLRFQAPQPRKPWNGELDATEPPKICVQRNEVTRSIVGEEDCLYLNVHILQEPNNDNLKPVMVFIHGGGFENGSGDEYSAEHLIEYDVILVTVNYRLHVFGFLNLGLPECPGNVGLKDQLLALKWIKENIREFGGDESNITIFGESAGSASVSYLMLSPLAKGLFQKAIAQSGSPRSPWALTDEPVENAFNLAVALGYTGDPEDRKSLHQFLMKVSPEELVLKYYKSWPRSVKSLFCTLRFVPSVEFGIDSHLAFLPEHPEVLLTKMTPIPLMTGLTDLEGLIFVLVGFGVEGYLSMVNEDSPKCFVPRKWLDIPDIGSRIGNKIRQFYFKDSTEITIDHLQELIAILSDVNFNLQLYDIPKAIKQKDKSIPVYVYRFNYEGELNALKKLCASVAEDCCKVEGSCHGDELGYLFKVQNPMFYSQPEQVDRETNMIDTLCRLWTNFAKYGNPTPSPFEIEWKSFQMADPCYLNIRHPIDLHRGLVFEDRFKLWESVTQEVESLNKPTRLKL